MLLAQPGPDRKGRVFGTAAAELSETIELPDDPATPSPPFREIAVERVLEGGGPETGN